MTVSPVTLERKPFIPGYLCTVSDSAQISSDSSRIPLPTRRCSIESVSSCEDTSSLLLNNSSPLIIAKLIALHR